MLTGKSNKIIVHLYALCWNEEKFLPFFLDYYSSFVNKIVIYDNYSDDNSEKIIRQFKNTEIIKYDSKGEIDDLLYLEIKNNAWKKSRGKADFVIVCDLDEILYAEEIETEISKLIENKYTIIKPFGYSMFNEVLPEFIKGIKITDIIKTGVPDDRWYSKSILFNPNKILEVNYFKGCHNCRPKGKVKFYKSENFKLLHYKFIDIEYVVNRKKSYALRLSKNNIKNNYGNHYLEDEKSTISSMKCKLAEAYRVIK